MILSPLPHGLKRKLLERLKTHSEFYEILDELLRLDPEERWFLSDAKTYLVNLKAKSAKVNECLIAHAVITMDDSDSMS
jgi:hypothetical protein